MCMIDGCDERYEVYSEKWVSKARKDHKCDECNRTIKKGEEYRFTTGALDGYWNSNHVCHHCTFATRWLWTNCYGYVDGGVHEDIQYHLEEEIRPGHPCFYAMARVFVGMNRRWKSKSGELMPLPREIPPLPDVSKVA